MHFATNHLRWGEHRGGMFVEVGGADSSGRAITRSWHLLAEEDDGPLIPSMPAAAIVKNFLEGRLPAAGARAATRELDLEDYDALFAERAITTGIRDPVEPRAPLYKRILGSAWDALPEPIGALHSVEGRKLYTGRAHVERGAGILSKIIASIVGFPKAGNDIPVTVQFDVDRQNERWTRNFSGGSFSSLQFEGKGAWAHLLCERFGPFTFGIALVREPSRLRLVIRRWSVFGIPLPIRLCPRCDAFETAENGRFYFYVEIGMPGARLLVHYRGWLEPQ